LDDNVKYEEYLKLLDIYNALKFEAPRQHFLELSNKGLVEALQGSDMYLSIRFKEAFTKYDPFKQRVVQALSKGLTNASVDHQVIGENELYQAQRLDTEILNSEKYPYKPDIVMAYKGQKVGVFVVPEIQASRDTQQAMGVQNFRQRLLEKANKGIATLTLPINSVVN
jgi:hypothetical protein